MKINPTNLELTSEVIPSSSPVAHKTARFQVIVEYAPGVCLPSAVADSPGEAVEAFMLQAPGCEEGDIFLFDRNEQRAVAWVKWKIIGTEIGVSASFRMNVFHDWYFALIACEFLRRRSTRGDAE